MQTYVFTMMCVGVASVYMEVNSVGSQDRFSGKSTRSAARASEVGSMGAYIQALSQGNSTNVTEDQIHEMEKYAGLSKEGLRGWGWVCTRDGQPVSSHTSAKA